MRSPVEGQAPIIPRAQVRLVGQNRSGILRALTARKCCCKFDFQMNKQRSRRPDQALARGLVLDRAPTEIVKTNVRLTTQPCDAPPTEQMFQQLMEHLDSDELLLFSTDYPHWQFDGDDVLPPGLSREMVRKIMIDNPRATYPRLAT